MRLYELTIQYTAVEAMAADEDVPPEAIADTLEGIQGLMVDKGRAIGAVLKNMQAGIDALKAEEDRLKRKRQALERRWQWLQDYLLQAMQVSAITEISHPAFTIRVRPNPPSCIIDSERDLPEWAIETVITSKVLKAEIRRRLLEGEAVEGAHLERGTRLEIR